MVTFQKIMHIHRHVFFNLERETNQRDGAGADDPDGSDPAAAVIPVADAWAEVDPVADAWQPLVGGGGGTQARRPQDLAACRSTVGVKTTSLNVRWIRLKHLTTVIPYRFGCCVSCKLAPGIVQTLIFYESVVVSHVYYTDFLFIGK
jgi:hypothetical protein